MSYRRYGDLGEKKQPTPQHFEVVEIQNFEHKQDLIRKYPVLCIDVFANWCNPCKQIAPEYAVMAKNYAPMGCMLVKEDLQKGLSKEFNIQAVPAFLIFQRGAIVQQVTGANLNEVKSALDKVLENNQQQAQSVTAPVEYYSQNSSQQHYSQQRPRHQQGGGAFNMGNRHRYG